MTPDPEHEDTDRLEKALDVLSEHFDTVQIFATRHEPGLEDGTVSVYCGRGNWYARAGQIQEWIVKHTERTKEVIKHEENE